ncbi:MAG: GDSL-type esterase/lipase family protein [Thermoanaerobaculia bacterium]|nr:GDSL-type esterase/lipase family protein [Thermoanaerobaculia bacterium]
MASPGRNSRRLTAALLIAATLASLPALAADRWQEAMDRFAAMDRESPPAPGGVLFLGSSSIRLWDLDSWFPGRHLTNRGFGGSQIADSIRHFDTLVVPHAPSRIFFYAGDNDVAAGKSADEVAADFGTFARLVWESLPQTEIYFIAIKPSLARWGMWAEMKAANAAIARAAAGETRLHFVDVASPGLGRDGKPRQEIFVDDGLHLNEAGYRMWTEIVTPLLP